MVRLNDLASKGYNPMTYHEDNHSVFGFLKLELKISDRTIQVVEKKQNTSSIDSTRTKKKLSIICQKNLVSLKISIFWTQLKM